MPHKNEKDKFAGARRRGNRRLNFYKIFTPYKQKILYICLQHLAMSQVTNVNNMKSTLKIAYAPQGNLGKPVIKIVQPVEVVNPTEHDRYIGGDEGQDELIRNFLQFPMSPALNEWFQVDTRFPVPMDERKTTHFVTTIAAVDESDLFFRFKHSILNRLIPFEDQVTINRSGYEVNNKGVGTKKAERIDESIVKHERITEFFNWLEQTDPATWDEQQPTDADGRPRN